MALKAENFTKEEVGQIELLKADDTNFKTPSQRLRNTLYVCWEQKNEGFKSFDNYYINKMEEMINHFKNKLV